MMTVFTSAYFQEINANSPEDYYEATIVVNGVTTEVDLNIEKSPIDVARLELVDQFINNLSIYDKQNRASIKQNYKDNEDGDIQFYVNDFLENMDDETIEEALGVKKDTPNIEALFLEKLQLSRVGLYPYDNATFAVFDYTIGSEYTDSLIAVSTNEKGELDHTALES